MVKPYTPSVSPSTLLPLGWNALELQGAPTWHVTHTDRKQCIMYNAALWVACLWRVYRHSPLDVPPDILSGYQQLNVKSLLSLILNLTQTLTVNWYNEQVLLKQLHQTQPNSFTLTSRSLPKTFIYLFVCLLRQVAARHATVIQTVRVGGLHSYTEI